MTTLTISDESNQFSARFTRDDTEGSHAAGPYRIVFRDPSAIIAAYREEEKIRSVYVEGMLYRDGVEGPTKVYVMWTRSKLKAPPAVMQDNAKSTVVESNTVDWDCEPYSNITRLRNEKDFYYKLEAAWGHFVPEFFGMYTEILDQADRFKSRVNVIRYCGESLGLRANNVDEWSKIEEEVRYVSIKSHSEIAPSYIGALQQS